MKTKCWLLSFSIGLVSLAHAEDTSRQLELKQKISLAITKFEQTDRTDWSYQVSRYENEEGDITQSVEQYHPLKGSHEKWSLLSLNGEAPTEKQTQKFIDRKQDEATEKDEKNINLRLGEIIQLDTVKFESENQEHLKASFKVNISQMSEDANDKLIGSLKFNKQHQFIQSIEITNSAAFSPMFSAKITDFKLTFTFFQIDSAILPHELRLNMQGTFAFFTEILEESVDTFSDYQHGKALTP